MRVAVITPYYEEERSILQRCWKSVANQTFACRHFMVADGKPYSKLDNIEGIEHIKLPIAHGDYGDTPRLIGSISAIAQDYDAICWLDADNWFEPDHVETMVALAHREGTSVVTATRNLYRSDGTLLGICTESDGDHFNDTSCYFITQPHLSLAVSWGFKDKRAAIVGDRIVWQRTKELVPSRAHCRRPTVNYTTTFAVHYLERNEAPPEGAKIIITKPGEKYPTSILYKEYVELCHNSL